MTETGTGRDPLLALDPLLELARSDLDTATIRADARRDPSFARVRARLTRARARRLVPVLAGLAAVGVVLAIYGVIRPRPLSFTVAGAVADPGGYVRAPDGSEVGLRFSDGTEVAVARAGRMHVSSTGPRGARVRLHGGRARVHVIPRPGNDWIFDAGPCQVHVTGTRFEMRWLDAEEKLEVLLLQGSVVVEGPPSPAGVTVHEGQRLVMDVRNGVASLGPLEPEPAATPTLMAPEPAPRTFEPASEPSEMPRDEPSPTTRPRPRPSWAGRVLAGDFGGVLRAARRRGFARVLAHDGPAEVMALAEAARYSRALPLTRRALGVVRSRFPRSPQAHKAAFLLGRLAEDHDGNLRAALGWYDEYLDAGPDGAYRDEALGRKMTATLRLAGPGTARPLADEYLRRYPDGAYAEPARALAKPVR